MDLPYTSSNITLIQFDAEEGLSDYSADWDAFSFEDELNTRKNILEKDLKAYNKLLNQPSTDNFRIGEALDEFQTKKLLCDQMVTANESTFSKCMSLIDKQENSKRDLKKLTLSKHSLDNEIKNLREEETTSRKTYSQLKLALQKAIDKYTTYFDIHVSTKTLSDTTYESSVFFKENEEFGPFKFIVDRVNQKVIDFQSNGILSGDEEEDIKKKIGNLENIPGLFCALHEIALKKINM